GEALLGGLGVVGLCAEGAVGGATGRARLGAGAAERRQAHEDRQEPTPVSCLHPAAPTSDRAGPGRFCILRPPPADCKEAAGLSPRSRKRQKPVLIDFSLQSPYHQRPPGHLGCPCARQGGGPNTQPAPGDSPCGCSAVACSSSAWVQR